VQEREQKESRKKTDTEKKEVLPVAEDPPENEEAQALFFQTPPLVESTQKPKPPTQALVSTERFNEWWELWSFVRGTNHKKAAVQSWMSIMRPELESSCMECTLSYLDSLSNPAIGYNPENFLFEQAKQKFEARWPKSRSPTEDKNQKRRNDALAFTKYMGGNKN
jgi:hypothetical protein